MDLYYSFIFHLFFLLQTFSFLFFCPWCCRRLFFQTMKSSNLNCENVSVFILFFKYSYSNEMFNFFNVLHHKNINCGIVAYSYIRLLNVQYFVTFSCFTFVFIDCHLNSFFKFDFLYFCF